MHVHELELPPALIATVKVADPEQGSFPFRLTGGATDELHVDPPDTIAEVIKVRPSATGVEYTITEQPVPGWDGGATCWLFDADGNI